jgi:hypothetical protein
MFTHPWRHVWLYEEARMAEMELELRRYGERSTVSVAAIKVWLKHSIDAASENDLAGTTRALQFAEDYGLF